MNKIDSTYTLVINIFNLEFSAIVIYPIVFAGVLWRVRLKQQKQK